MQASLQTSVGTTYNVHEMQSAAGTVVREYISSAGESAGKVFAVTWQGPWPPDMRQLLGSYFEQYMQAAKCKERKADRTQATD